MPQFCNQLMKEISMFQELPVPTSKVLVWAFIPYCIKE
jgi:hypothetical protein